MRISKKILNLIGITALAVILIGCSSDSNSSKGKTQSNNNTVQTVQAEENNTPGSVGSKAGNFQLSNLEEEQVQLKDFSGKVVMLNFWGVWCPPCRKEIPDLVEIQKEYKDKDFTIVSIALPKGPIGNIENFVEEKGINYPVLIGKRSELAAVYEEFGRIRAVPTTFLLDEENVIRHKWRGARSKEQFLQEVEKLIK